MACAIYNERPQVCQDFSCGKPCEHCGRCCCEISIPNLVFDKEAVEWLAMHRITQRENDVLVYSPCIHYMEENHE